MLRTNRLFPARDFREGEPELMDLPQPVSPALMGDLRSLQRLNRLSGSYALVRRFLRRWLRPGQAATVLDLCTATADIPRHMVDWARRRSVTLRIDAVDFQETTVAIARRELAAYPEIRVLHADALRFEAAAPYDFVFCSLALHHFSKVDAVTLLRRARALTRRAVLVADVERSDLGVIGIYLVTTLLFRNPMMRHDGRLSLRRAFSGSEVRALATEAGWGGFDYGRFPVARHAVWLEGLEGDRR